MSEDASHEEHDAAVNEGDDRALEEARQDDRDDAGAYDERTEGGPDPDFTPNRELENWLRASIA